MPLPTEKTQPLVQFTQMPILIHGRPKIGKSTFCAQAPNALFISTQSGLNHLSTYSQPVSNWKDIVTVYEELKTGDHKFGPIVIDMVDDAYQLCVEHFCRKHEMDHPSDLDYGKGWAIVNTPFKTMLNRFALLNRGLILECHSKEKDITTRLGKKTKWVPTLPGSIADSIAAFVEMILFFTIEETKDPSGEMKQRRVIRTVASSDYEAGSRVKGLPDPIDLDYNTFIQALDKAIKERKTK